MKKHFKTEGIVLRKVDLNEADRIITVLTKDYGKIDLIAKGGRKLKNKFCGNLELLNLVELTGSWGQKDLHYLKEIQTLHGIGLLTQKKQYEWSFYFAEITHRLIQSDQHIEEVYDLSKEVLFYLNHSHQLKLLIPIYLIKLLTKIGFLPLWHQCSDCNEKLDLTQNTYLCKQDGHLKCQYCAQSEDSLISASMVKWINYVQHYSFSDIFKVKTNIFEEKKTQEIVQKVIQNLLNYPLKSEGFMTA